MAVVGAPKADAALIGSFHVCQGATCVDFGVVVRGSWPTSITCRGLHALRRVVRFENSAFSETSNTNIQIFRTSPGTGSATALDVWFTVVGYTQPAGPQFVMNTTGSASKTGSATDSVSYTAWYSSTNSFAGSRDGRHGRQRQSRTPAAERQPARAAAAATLRFGSATARRSTG